jgi:hypothetical protein
MIYINIYGKEGKLLPNPDLTFQTNLKKPIRGKIPQKNQKFIFLELFQLKILLAVFLPE